MASAPFSLGILLVELTAVTEVFSLLSLNLALFQVPWPFAFGSILDHMSVRIRAPLINHTSRGSCSDQKNVGQRLI